MSGLTQALDSNRSTSNSRGIVSLAGRDPSADFVNRIPISFARRYCLMGLVAPDSQVIDVAIDDLGKRRVLDTVRRWLGGPVTPCLAGSEEILAAINLAYEQRSGRAEKVLVQLQAEEALRELREAPSGEDLLDAADRAPVVRLVNALIAEAATTQASDIHVQPYQGELIVRMRIDGILHDVHTIPKPLQEEVLSRFKIIGRMNIAEKRLPQDGRASVEVGDRRIDLRIASLPTSHGERVVIRLLDKSVRLYSLEELGMAPENLAQFKRMIHLEHGMVLVTGPTGSGKSTTLYSALREINTKDRNAVTLEDPIEYQLDGISQTQVNSKKGLTFAAGLRSVLRQDPDIIMVGEIRDRETAVMAIQSALTGHLVFSTLHTNDAASAVTRLLDLGIEPYLAASSLLGVLAQRLVRRICGQCAQAHVPSAEELRQIGLEKLPHGAPRKGNGCAACRGTGYRGRFAISELLVVDDAVRHHIQIQSNASQVLDTAIRSGMRTMRDDGFQKICVGQTTLEEVARVTVSQL